MPVRWPRSPTVPRTRPIRWGSRALRGPASRRCRTSSSPVPAAGASTAATSRSSGRSSPAAGGPRMERAVGGRVSRHERRDSDPEPDAPSSPPAHPSRPLPTPLGDAGARPRSPFPAFSPPSRRLSAPAGAFCPATLSPRLAVAESTAVPLSCPDGFKSTCAVGRCLFVGWCVESRKESERMRGWDSWKGKQNNREVERRREGEGRGGGDRVGGREGREGGRERERDGGRGRGRAGGRGKGRGRGREIGENERGEKEEDEENG